MAQPAIYSNTTPTISNGSLSPLQLALAVTLLEPTLSAWNESPIFVNREFVSNLLDFSDSKFLSPNPLDYKTEFTPNLLPPGITAISYIVGPDDYIYALRKALDCGPNENRLEQIKLGPRQELAEGTFAYYGSTVRGGAICSGGGGPYGTGGIGSVWPGPTRSFMNPYATDVANVTSSFDTTAANSFLYGESIFNLSVVTPYAQPGTLT